LGSNRTCLSSIHSCTALGACESTRHTVLYEVPLKARIRINWPHNYCWHIDVKHGLCFLECVSSLSLSNASSACECWCRLLYSSLFLLAYTSIPRVSPPTLESSKPKIKKRLGVLELVRISLTRTLHMDGHPSAYL
jgi:hypothetical protein